MPNLDDQRLFRFDAGSNHHATAQNGHWAFSQLCHGFSGQSQNGDPVFQAGRQQSPCICTHLGSGNQMNSWLRHELIVGRDFGALDAVFVCVLEGGVGTGHPCHTKLGECGVSKPRRVSPI